MFVSNNCPTTDVLKLHNTCNRKQVNNGASNTAVNDILPKTLINKKKAVYIFVYNDSHVSLNPQYGILSNLL